MSGTRWLVVALLVALPLLALQASASEPVEQPYFGQLSDVAGAAPDRIVVVFQPWVSAAAAKRAHQSRGARLIEKGYRDAFHVVRVPALARDRVLAAYRRMPEVVAAEPDYISTALATPNDSFFFPYQWNLYDHGVLSSGVASSFGIQAQAAWDTSTGANVTIAVVDTGIAYEDYGKQYKQAPDLVGVTFAPGYDFVNNDSHPNDDNGHGTHVAGTLAQATNNGKGCAGIAYSARLMPVKVLSRNGSGYDSWIASGIRFAADHGAKVINLSLGGPGDLTVLHDAVAYAYGKGVTIVAAAGNESSAFLGYPAGYNDEVIAVGATRFDGRLAPYSNYGPDVDLVAPGGDLSVDQNGDGKGDGILQQTFWSSTKKFGYYFFQGTSMATPHVAAVAALVRSVHPGYSVGHVRAALEDTADDLGAPGKDTTYGYGLVDAAAAIGH
jgi:serine protease